MIEIKKKIKDAIINFNNGNLTEASINLFNTLGYPTDRQNPFSQITRQLFHDSFLNVDIHFNEQRTFVKADWKYGAIEEKIEIVEGKNE